MIAQAIYAECIAAVRERVRPGWRHINVHRFLLTIKESIDEGTQWVVFEPNYEPLQTRVGRAMAQENIETAGSCAWSESRPMRRRSS